MTKLAEAEKLLTAVQTLYAIQDSKGARPYADLYLVTKKIFERYPAHLDASFHLNEADRNQMKEEIRYFQAKNDPKTTKWTKGVYSQGTEAQANADATLKSVVSGLRANQQKKVTSKDPTYLLYLTHGAQYCLWWGQDSLPASDEVCQMFGKPLGTQQDVLYRHLLCLQDIDAPTFTDPNNSTQLERLDVFVECLLSCPGMSVTQDTVETWYNNLPFPDPKNSVLHRQQLHLKMVLFMLRCQRNFWPIVKTIVPKDNAVKNAALALYKQYCFKAEFMCLPFVGVKRLDLFDTLVASSESTFAWNAASLNSLLHPLSISVTWEHGTYHLLYDGRKVEISEDEQRHVMYRWYNNKWEQHRGIYALAPVFANMFVVFDSEEACRLTCGYDCDNQQQCVFRNTFQARQFIQQVGKTLNDAKQACETNCSNDVQGYNCRLGKCVPTNDRSCTYSKATYGSLEKAKVACLQNCKREGGYSCFATDDKKNVVDESCMKVSRNAQFSFAQYGDEAKAMCNQASTNQCKPNDQFDPFRFYKIATVTGKECEDLRIGTLPKGIYTLTKPQRYLEFYFRPNRGLLKGIVMNHAAGSGKTVTAQAIISNFIDFPNPADVWNVLWVTKKSLLSQPLEDFYAHPSGGWRRAILTPTKTDVVKWTKRSSYTQWFYINAKGCKASVRISDAHTYLPVDRNGVYNTALDTPEKQGIRYAISKYCVMVKGDNPPPRRQRERISQRFNTPGGQVKRGSGQFKALTYDSFVNLINNERDTENDTIRKYFHTHQRRHDILQRTLIIVDEAHNMMLQTNPQMAATTCIESFQAGKNGYETVLKALHKSYTTSLENSCKVVLMTATPITKSPEQALQLLHLIQQDRTRWINTRVGQHQTLPTIEGWREQLTLSGNITFETKQRFIRLLGNNKMSYYAGDIDPRYFAQKVWGDLSQYPTTGVEAPRDFSNDDFLMSSMSTRMVQSVHQHIESCNTIEDFLTLLMNVNISLQQTRKGSVSVDEIGIKPHANQKQSFYLKADHYEPTFLKVFKGTNLTKTQTNQQNEVQSKWNQQPTDPFLQMLNQVYGKFQHIEKLSSSIDANRYRDDNQSYWSSFLTRYIRYALFRLLVPLENPCSITFSKFQEALATNVTNITDAEIDRVLTTIAGKKFHEKTIDYVRNTSITFT